MSAAQSEITLEGRLGALQCHFTWDLESGRNTLLSIKDELQDIGTEEGCKWLGHIYNLQGYVHFQLGSIEEARSFFTRAAEAFRKMRGAEEGPWLVVTYGNQAWLHHHQGEQEESLACLSKIDGLMTEDPSQDELHPEICAEKAWTLMKFSEEKKLLAADYFQRAIHVQPDMVEWQTSHVLLLANTFKHSNLREDIWEKMKIAKEQDPENLYLAAIYLLQLANRGQTDQSGACELATKVLRNPVSSYSGIKPLLWFYKTFPSMDEAVALAEEALKLHPDERYLKRCAAYSYRWKIWKDSDPSPSLIEKGIRAYEELLSLYPDSSLRNRTYLASIYAKSESTKAKSEKIYEELLAEDLEPAEQQILFNSYAKHLYSTQRQPKMSIQYHMKAVEIPIKSDYQGSSIKILNQIRSAAKSEITPNGRLGALQCHFTWDLEPGRKKLLRIKDMLQDIGTEEGCKWLGHIYNLQGYLHFQLGSIEEARSFFSRAAEAFRKMRGAEEGPWLVVTYGNQAWLHHHQGEQEESLACLSKIDGLMNEDPSQDELHPEICAEKAWTLMKFRREQKLLADDYFQRAIRMQPDMVEWQTSQVLALVYISKQRKTGVEADIMEKLRKAKEQDPENLYLAAIYLLQLAKRGQTDQSGARELATKVLRNPVSSYSGIKPLLWFYKTFPSLDEAVDLAEEALKLHPDERYLKRCVALTYKWKIWEKDSRPSPSLIEKGIRAYEELLSLYPDSSFMRRMDIANIYAKSENTKAKSEKIFRQLLAEDLEPAEQQVLFNIFAKHLYFIQRQPKMSKEYHMKAAEIPIKSFFQGNSLMLLEKIRHRQDNQEVDRFLSRLEESQK